MFLYVTSDKIGSETGGGIVTKNEIDALSSLGHVLVMNPSAQPNPFDTEAIIFQRLANLDLSKIKLAHFYAGTYPEFVKYLKNHGVKVTYTVAAHDNVISKEEHESLGIPYSYPHMVDEELFKKYVSSYVMADLVINPSKISADFNQKLGCRTTIIPHGCEMYRAKPYPKTFNLGYLGQVGPDKGLRYLLEAWAILNYDDAVLHIAGSQSTSLLPMIRHFGKGNVNILGFVKSVEDFYNTLSVYVQPSATEGFGIEVLEAMAAGRPVVVSNGAGAADCVNTCGIVVEKRNATELAHGIRHMRNVLIPSMIEECQNNAKNYLWDKIKGQYVALWKTMI